MRYCAFLNHATVTGSQKFGIFVYNAEALLLRGAKAKCQFIVRNDEKHRLFTKCIFVLISNNNEK